jgi:uncharacterized protein YdcH (DUF465 family)
MSSVSDKLGKFLDSAFKKVFDRENNIDNGVQSIAGSEFLYETIQEYKDAGYHFRRTKDQISRGLTREESFEEFKNKKKL